MLSKKKKAIVIGAGVGGLTAAVDLARQGLLVSVFEKEAHVGGKLRTLNVDGYDIDVGPTVMTMPWVLGGLFEDLGKNLSDYIPMTQSNLVGRHVWSGGRILDLYTDIERSTDAISALFGEGEANGYRAFCAYSERIYKTTLEPFLLSQRPGLVQMVRKMAKMGPRAGFHVDAGRSMWRALRSFFKTPELRQLFGRYATYSGCSPFDAPATLNLIAHVEREGVYYVKGGMIQVARGLRRVAEELGVQFFPGHTVSEIMVHRGKATGVQIDVADKMDADIIVANVDVAALRRGLLHKHTSRWIKPVPLSQRSLSALTFALVGKPEGIPMARHNVVFSNDYRKEFQEILRERRLPTHPSVYICAQDRIDAMGDEQNASDNLPERFFLIVNAPAFGDLGLPNDASVEECASHAFGWLEQCGITFNSATKVHTTPHDFHKLFPATGGALYGRLNHGMTASFKRQGARTPIEGLYLAGGSVHPGAGVPMAALSGRLAAAAILEDSGSTVHYGPTATNGFTWMGKATMENTPSPSLPL